MENVFEKANANGVAENGYHTSSLRHCNYQSTGIIKTSSLSWLDLRVFYVRVSKCEIDDSTPEFFKLNHVPLDRNTLLEVNGIRTSIFSDGISTLLRRDRVDKKSEEVTFVSTDSIRMTGSVKLEVFDKDVLVLYGALELCNTNAFIGTDSRNHEQCWTMHCESDIPAGTDSLLKGSPAIEVYVAGCFSGAPIVLTKTLQLGHRRKQIRKAMLDSIPEFEATERQNKNLSSGLGMQVGKQNYKPEYKEYSDRYPGEEYLEGEDGELSCAVSPASFLSLCYNHVHLNNIHIEWTNRKSCALIWDETVDHFQAGVRKENSMQAKK
ncbi:hypothetical protein ACH5RR_002331 [Cinchona calisaya]|uniref:Uncharacterized protein n=1 Tax=Cinchona calisaya TaxID=153742 RepID=A0ABD3B5Y8_9GENT